MSIQLSEIVTKLRERSQSDLTPRELEVLRWMAKGLVSQQIAKRIGSTRSTVDNQRVSIMEKLGAVNSVHAVYLACHRGLI